ncbi:MAG TPA: PKD domain-containing protein [Bacteroidia bacterium]|nr:PKD domain-containing protein [Bacteroidia bacterium]
MKTTTLSLLFVALAANPLHAKQVRLAIGNAEFTSYTRIGFLENASPAFDRNLDQEMKNFPSNQINYIYSVDNNHQMYVNYCPIPNGCISIPLAVNVADTGTFNFLIDDIDGDLEHLQFAMVDQAGRSIYLRPGIISDIFFSPSDFNTEKKYTLFVFPRPCVMQTPVNCPNAQDGSIHVAFKGNGEWSARLRSVTSLLCSITTESSEAQFMSLKHGVYIVQILKNGMPVYEEYTAVQRPLSPRANFVTDKDSVSVNETVYVENTSTGTGHWNWNFGDETSSALHAPSHRYSTPGNYEISLIVSDVAGCTSVSTRSIRVTPPTVASTQK